MKELENYLRTNLEEYFCFDVCNDKVIIIVCVTEGHEISNLRLRIQENQNGGYIITHRNSFLTHVYRNELKVFTKEEVIEEIHRCYWALVSLEKDKEMPKTLPEIVDYLIENLPDDADINTTSSSKIEIKYPRFQLEFDILFRKNQWGKQSIHVDVIKRNQLVHTYKMLSDIQRIVYHIYLTIDRERKYYA